MKKMKKALGVIVLSLVLSTGMIGVAFASGWVNWRGETYVSQVEEVLIFLDGKLDTTLSDNKKLKEELAAHLDEDSSAPNGLAKLNKELRDENKQLKAEIVTLKEDKTSNEKTIADLKTERDTLKTELSDAKTLNDTLTAKVAALDSEKTKLTTDNAALQTDVDNLKGINAQQSTELEAALLDVQELNELAAGIKDKYINTDPVEGEQ